MTDTIHGCWYTVVVKLMIESKIANIHVVLIICQALSK